MICYELLNLKQPYDQCDSKDSLIRTIRSGTAKPKCSFEEPKYLPYIALYNACVDDIPKQRPNVLQLKQMVWELPTS